LCVGCTYLREHWFQCPQNLMARLLLHCPRVKELSVCWSVARSLPSTNKTPFHSHFLFSRILCGCACSVCDYVTNCSVLLLACCIFVVCEVLVSCHLLRVFLFFRYFLFYNYRGADKSLARPRRKQARKHVKDARDFNNIETRAVIKFLFLQGKASNEIPAILTETLDCFLLGRAKD